MDQNNEETKQPRIKMKISDEVEAGQYVNAVSVHINNNECILDMGFHLPNSAEPTVKVVNRIAMNHRTAESFLKVLSNAILDWKNKQKGE